MGSHRHCNGGGDSVTMRRLPAESYASVKTATRLLREELGGIDAMAACTRAVRSLVSDYGNPGSDRFIPADVILDCERVAGVTPVTEALARAQGCAVVRLTAAGASDALGQLVAVQRAIGTLHGAIGGVLARSRVGEDERGHIVALLEQAAAAALTARAAVQGEAT